MGTNAALEKKISSLQEMVSSLTKSIEEDREKREKEKEKEIRPVMRTEGRMVETGEMLIRTGYLETPGNGQCPPNVPPIFKFHPPEERYLPTPPLPPTLPPLSSQYCPPYPSQGSSRHPYGSYYPLGH
ncbi:hypothetical protein M231_03685 [Tremella mesenterica]|uniref:Uncharacterized protein n=1 Tax=Tremella mesenterica TaxID=5217 RepID=A0A4Q1BMJ6_TREME|nr:hypothetical protein M231_03685 [Tremella mesenterica]